MTLGITALSAVMLNVIMLSVVAPYKTTELNLQKNFFLNKKYCDDKTEMLKNKTMFIITTIFIFQRFKRKNSN
jgi:hypothetical protein